MSERKMHRRSQANLKERVRERNMRRTGLGKAYEPLSAGANGESRHSVHLKSILANNRALARALQEEKLKVRRARDAFLCLKRENECLKFEFFYLTMLLQSWQMWAPAESARTFPPVPLMIPVVTGQDHCVGVPRHNVEHEEFPESEMKATADDNRPAGCFSKDFCESASADAVKETDPECEI
ncbi:shugoshin 1-like isoform X2 [Neopsephotus bourkii]|uniref:shugoshin 1-like isoform X2 n=1 Tax=Neopsephotus bourkii TaxID=309878 RepID=UPI002AA5252B|nr:shugoshin 1-like isoform X2 [Neopsephotus bourkii]